MALPKITLTGSALQGVDSHLIPKHLLAALPQAVMLGRLPARPHRQVLCFSRFYDRSKATTPPPASINRRAKAAASISRMYLNDRLGDCVFAGKAHAYGVWSANDSDSGGIVLATDKEIQDQYFAYTGGQDSGANIEDVLNICKAKGFLMGGKRYLIDGYVAVDWTKQLQVQVSLLILGASSIGIDLPEDWTRNAVWDVTTSRIVGGHDVTPIDYDDTGVYVASWGRIYRITWPAFTSRKWLSEMYVMLAPLWYGSDKMAPSGFDVTKLRAALATIGSGGVPDITPPTPPVPPTPPTPPIPPGPGKKYKVLLTSDSPITGALTRD